MFLSSGFRVRLVEEDWLCFVAVCAVFIVACSCVVLCCVVVKLLCFAHSAEQKCFATSAEKNALRLPLKIMLYDFR